MLNVTINETVNNLWLVSRGSVFEKILDHSDFHLLDLLSHGWSTHTVSVDYNLLRQLFILSLPDTDSVIDKISENPGPLLSDLDFLNFSSAQSWIAIFIFLGNLRHFLLEELGVALSEGSAVCRTAANELAASIHDEVDSDEHGVFEVGKIHSVEVLLDLCIHLLKKVREDTKRELST